MTHISNLQHNSLLCPGCATNILLANHANNEQINTVEIVSYVLIALGILILLVIVGWFFTKNWKNKKKTLKI